MSISQHGHMYLAILTSVLQKAYKGLGEMGDFLRVIHGGGLMPLCKQKAAIVTL